MQRWDAVVVRAVLLLLLLRHARRSEKRAPAPLSTTCSGSPEALMYGRPAPWLLTGKSDADTDRSPYVLLFACSGAVLIFQVGASCYSRPGLTLPGLA